jgi:hypothetical protein
MTLENGSFIKPAISFIKTRLLPLPDLPVSTVTLIPKPLYPNAF